MPIVYRRNPRIEESPLQDEVMLYDNEKSQFYVMNQTMAHVWQQCDGERSVEDIATSVHAHFAHVESAAVEADLAAAIAELTALDLIEVVR